MATDIVFNMYDLLVNNIFGGIGISLIALAAIFVIILVICRSSMVFITYWLIFYFTVVGTMYLGALGLVLTFLVVTTYTMIGVIRAFFRET